MPSTYVSYQQINSLEEFAFIAGTDYLLEFAVYEEDGVTAADIGGATIKWILSPYGQSINILELNGTITGTNTFEVEIPAASTENLAGKYIQQPVIQSFFGQTYRPAQGVVLVIPQTPLN